MDTKKVGSFLKSLRKEKELTQEQLGEKLGVTNKTVSRWETGNYMPPVECLEMLSDIYQVSINEMLAGERVPKDNFSEVAENNITDALAELEKENTQFKNKMILVLVISTILAMAILYMLPLNSVKEIIVFIMVIALAFITNTLNFTLNLVAVAVKKTRE
jgi:transcriptional regulator with XRE-family HTH domain